MTLTYGSMCSGYGGLDLAVEAVFGAEPLWHFEVEPAACKVLAAHWPGVPNHGDLTTADWSELPRPDVLCAGYPCQPFSTAGRRQGTNDDRHLWPHIADAIRVLRPRWAVFENVAGHLSLGFDAVLADLAALGFDAEWSVVRAADVGAPHRRERLFVLAADAGCERLGQHPGGAPTQEARAAGGHVVADHRGSRPAADGRQAAADASHVGHERSGSARHRRHGPADDGGATADADGGRQSQQPQQHRRAVEAAAEQARSRPGKPRRHAVRHDLEAVWQATPYAPAIERWQQVVGRGAPAPALDGRLSPAFVEWMMGLPDGWVTRHGLPRTAELRMLGNGVVPQQATYAIAGLLARMDMAVAS